MLADEINQAVLDRLQETVASDDYRFYAGPNSQALSEELPRLMKMQHGLLLSSGTAALEIALRTMNVGVGDHVLLSGYDYPGNFWAIERVGAIPVLIDCEPNCWRISQTELETAYQQYPSCKALVASHLHGIWQDAPRLRKWCDRVGIVFIEDACQAIGSTLSLSDGTENRALGSFGHFSLVSFGGGKVISSGRGGALLTNEESNYQRAKICAGAGSGPYGLSELQAASVMAQLPFLERINQASWQFFEQLTTLLRQRNLDEVGFELPAVAENFGGIESNGVYQMGLVLKESRGLREDRGESEDSSKNLSEYSTASSDSTGGSRDQLLATLGRQFGQDLPIGVGFSGFHRRSKRRCCSVGSLDNVRKLAASTLTLHHRMAQSKEWSVGTLASTLNEAL